MNDSYSEVSIEEKADLVSITDKDAYPYYIEKTYVRTSDEVTWGNLKRQMRKVVAP